MTLRILYSEQLAQNPSKALRILDPLRHLEHAGKVTRISLESLVRNHGSEMFLDTNALDTVDVVFLHVSDLNANTRPLLAPFLRQAIERGVAFVCDSDDPYFVPADGCSFQQQIAPHLAAIEELCPLAHVLSVTTEPLKREFEPMVRDIVVVPNHLDVHDAPRRPNANERLRIGWCGGPTHTDDLTAILPSIALLQREVSVDFVIFGMFDRNFEDTARKAAQVPRAKRSRDPGLAAFGRMADALCKVRYQHIPSTTYAEFPARLAALDFDIGLCPLLETRFNRCRSAVKFYQYAAAGTLTLASDVTAYREECSLLVDNDTQAWLHALKLHASDPTARAAAMEEQRARVRDSRNWTLGKVRYEELFTHAVEAAHARRRAPAA